MNTKLLQCPSSRPRECCTTYIHSFFIGKEWVWERKEWEGWGKKRANGNEWYFSWKCGKEGEELGNSFSGKSEKDRKEWYRMRRNEIFSWMSEKEGNRMKWGGNPWFIHEKNKPWLEDFPHFLLYFMGATEATRKVVVIYFFLAFKHNKKTLGGRLSYYVGTWLHFKLKIKKLEKLDKFQCRTLVL